jgi:hypothetical protein
MRELLGAVSALRENVIEIKYFVGWFAAGVRVIHARYVP